MRKARFTEHQKIALIKSVEVGLTVKDVCSSHFIYCANHYLSTVVLTSR